MRRAGAGISALALLLLAHHLTPASATSLGVDGGILQSWEFEADIRPAEPRRLPAPVSEPSATLSASAP